MYPSIEILSPHQKRFLAGYPWVYANELKQTQAYKHLKPGTLVTLHAGNQAAALGYINRHSLIAFRALTRNPQETINAAFFEKRLKEAQNLRQQFYPQPFYRLIHAESDHLPGLIIDRFDDVFVLQINTYGMELLIDPLVSAIQTLFTPKTILLSFDSAIRKSEDLEIKDSVFIGEKIKRISVIENAIPYSVDLESSQKTGWFYDHRENRQLISKLSQHKSIIDYFCYSGGFSIAAALAGATHVTAIDRSATALENAKASAINNQVSEKCTFVCKDVFDDMDERITRCETFDIVILDPPAFVKSKKDLNTGLKGYEKLITKGVQLTTNKGLLLIASCSYHVKADDLKTCLVKGLHKAKKQGKILKRLEAGFDHPILPILEESSYLKGFLVLITN